MSRPERKIPPHLQTYSIDEAAQMLGRSRRWVYYQMDAELIHFVYVGNARRITQMEIERILAEGSNHN